MNRQVMFSSLSDEWETPPEFYKALDAEFNFNLDVCATKSNAKCKSFFTKEDDGLSKNWGGIAYGAILHTERVSDYGFKRLHKAKHLL